jgi:hypothetical protein
VLKELDGHEVAKNPELKEALHKYSWDVLSNVSSNCQEVWESSGIPLPEVFQSQECWTAQEPSARELYTTFMDPKVHSQSFLLACDFSVLRSFQLKRKPLGTGDWKHPMATLFPSCFSPTKRILSIL